MISHKLTSQVLITRRPGIGSALEDLLVTRFVPKRWARRIWSAADLPPRLEQCAAGLARGCEWRAYGDDEQLFFAVARERDGERHSGTSVALEVFFLDADAAVFAAGVWEHDLKHGWWLDAVVELSYDFEHGWWFDRVAQPANSAEPQYLDITPPTDAGVERAWK